MARKRSKRVSLSQRNSRREFWQCVKVIAGFIVVFPPAGLIAYIMGLGF